MPNLSKFTFLTPFQTLSGALLAATAGLMAALASVAGKTATDATIVPRLIQNIQPVITSLLKKDEILGYTIEEATQTFFRVLSFVMIFVFNAIMMNAFVKAMNLSSSVTAVVINTASNFFFTAFFGMLVFGEPLSLLWWTGACLILCGVSIIAVSGTSAMPTATDESSSTSPKKKKAE